MRPATIMNATARSAGLNPHCGRIASPHRAGTRGGVCTGIVSRGRASGKRAAGPAAATRNRSEARLLKPDRLHGGIRLDADHLLARDVAFDHVPDRRTL